MKKSYQVLSLALLLVSCGQPNVRRTNSNGPNNVINNQALPAIDPPKVSNGGETLPNGTQIFQMNIEVKSVLTIIGLPDRTINSPDGLNAAYLSQNGQVVKMRVNIPPGALLDGRGRFISYDVIQKKVKVLYADNFATDSSADVGNLASTLNPLASFSQSQSGQLVFKKISSNQFISQSKLAGSTITSPANNLALVTSERLISTPSGATQKLTQTFDGQIGAITNITSYTNAQDVDQRSDSKILYTSVSVPINMLLPYNIRTSFTYTPKITGRSITATQDITFKNIILNGVSAGYFNQGGL